MVANQILEAVKKLPGNILGTPVDIANLILGAATGKGLDGYSKTPFLGSGHINDMLGQSISSSGAVEDITSLGLSFAVPGKAAMAGIAVPASLIKSFKEFNAAKKALDAGKDAEAVFKASGIYRLPGDPTLRANISDEGAKLTKGATKRVLDEYQSGFMAGPHTTLKVNVDHKTSKTLDSLYDNEMLYSLFPELKKVKVREGLFMAPGQGSFDASTNTIRVGEIQDSEAELLKVITHEVQHAVQTQTGLAGGGSPQQFFSDFAGHRKAGTELNKLLAQALNKNDKPAAKFLNEQLDKLIAVDKRAFEHYKTLLGETDARYAEMLAIDPSLRSKLPETVIDRKQLIMQPDQVAPVDTDPLIRAIVNWAK